MSQRPCGVATSVARGGAVIAPSSSGNSRAQARIAAPVRSGSRLSIAMTCPGLISASTLRNTQ
ncbi:MAG: hypothetical protein V9G10_15005 [Candidatus Nanopelagicales bacterium]